jgi:hypothetical protein
MRILFIKKCYVGGRLHEAGETAEVDNPDLYEGVAKTLGKPEVAEEKPAPKPIKPIKKGVKK